MKLLETSIKFVFVCCRDLIFFPRQTQPKEWGKCLKGVQEAL